MPLVLLVFRLESEHTNRINDVPLVPRVRFPVAYSLLAGSGSACERIFGLIFKRERRRNLSSPNLFAHGAATDVHIARAEA